MGRASFSGGLEHVFELLLYLHLMQVKSLSVGTLLNNNLANILHALNRDGSGNHRCIVTAFFPILLTVKHNAVPDHVFYAGKSRGLQ